MTTIDSKAIQERIKGLTAELRALEATHNGLVQENQQVNEQFRQKVVANQTRFANLQGAIEVLKGLQEPEGKNNEPKTDHPLSSDRIRGLRKTRV